MIKRFLLLSVLIGLWASPTFAQYGNPTNYAGDVRNQKTTNIGLFRMTLGHSAMTGSGILKDRNTHYVTFHSNEDPGRHHSLFGSRESLLGFGASNWNGGKIVLPGIPKGVTTKLYTKYPHPTLTIDNADRTLSPVYDE